MAVPRRPLEEGPDVGSLGKSYEDLPWIHHDDPDGIQGWIERTLPRLTRDLALAWELDDFAKCKDLMWDIRRGIIEIEIAIKDHLYRKLGR